VGLDPEDVFERLAPVRFFMDPVTRRIVGCPEGALGIVY